jgi:HlyD family secretion protein
MNAPLRIVAAAATAVRAIAISLVLAAALAACTEQGPPTFQGWIEANLIFVGPDESGRVEVLDKREGDKVE